MIYAVSFMKRRFLDLEPDWNHIKEALLFLDHLICDLDCEKNNMWQIQEQVTMLKNGDLTLRQQALLSHP
jgi:hypothetical protein